MTGAVTRAEWRWAALMAGAFMALTLVPYLLAIGAQGGEWRFSGALIAVEDGNSYIADMGQGARGAWLFTLPYTSEPHPPVLFFTLYLLLGRLVGPSHAALVTAFHAARVAGGFGLLLVSYRFLAEFLPGVIQRRLGLVLVAAGGGLGWLLALLMPAPLFGSLPIDFISPEAYSFLVLFGLPHLALARCLFLLGLLAYLRERGVAAGMLWLGVGLIQPLYVPVAWLIMAADWSVRFISERRFDAQRLKVPIIAGLISAPMLLYTIFVFSSDPILAQWNAQNRLPSPHPLHYVLSYGLWVIPAYFGWRILRQRQPRLAQFAAAWLVLVPVLLYLPIPTQRRLIEAVQLPLAALAVLGFTAVRVEMRRWAVVGMLVLLTPTTLLLILGASLAATRPAEPIFLPVGQVSVFNWLAREARPGQVALAAYDTGNALPAYTPLRAYIGHGPETIALEEKRPRVARFYAAQTPDAERQALLAEGRITYVLFGPHERALGSFEAEGAAYLELSFADGDYAVYSVRP